MHSERHKTSQWIVLRLWDDNRPHLTISQLLVECGQCPGQDAVQLFAIVGDGLGQIRSDFEL